MNSVKNSLNTLHISTLAIWDLGEGKGRVSTYYPLKAFVDKGHEVWFLTSSKNQKAGKIDGINIIRLRTIIKPLKKKHWEIATTYLHLPLFILTSIIQGVAISLKGKPSTVYAHDIYSALPAYILSKLTVSKYVLRLYGIVMERRPFQKLFQRAVFGCPADLYIVTNDGTFGDAIAREYKISPSKLCFWVNGISKDWLNEAGCCEDRRKLAPDNEKLVLSVGRLVAWKQVDVLIRAIPCVIKKCNKVKFIIVGDGDQRKQLEKLSKDLGITDFVRFEGAVHHSRAISYINVCDILVSMNALSSVCNPVLEAMVCGKPVVALNTGATSDLIQDGVNGVLVNVGEIDKLPPFLLSLLSSEHTRKKLGRNAQRFMLKHWPSWEDRTNSEVELIETLCWQKPEEFLKLKRRADYSLDLRKFRPECRRDDRKG